MATASIMKPVIPLYTGGCGQHPAVIRILPSVAASVKTVSITAAAVLLMPPKRYGYGLFCG